MTTFNEGLARPILDVEVLVDSSDFEGGMEIPIGSAAVVASMQFAAYREDRGGSLPPLPSPSDRDSHDSGSRPDRPTPDPGDRQRQDKKTGGIWKKDSDGNDYLDYSNLIL